ncbi:MAG: hypothetical protein HYR91_13595 [Flavobacteriia bacterium]|nr:hypothetical protein [Flavobacteriia bacterium]
MARNLTFNKISDNCFYIISEIKNSDKKNIELNKCHIKENQSKIPKPLSKIIYDLEELYPNFYDVNLYIYKAKKNATIIEIKYYSRLSLDEDYRQKTKEQETMLHCKITTPIYHSDTNEKFDINWELGTLNHKWKLFWWRRKKS